MLVLDSFKFFFFCDLKLQNCMQVYIYIYIYEITAHSYGYFTSISTCGGGG